MAITNQEFLLLDDPIAKDQSLPIGTDFKNQNQNKNKKKKPNLVKTLKQENFTDQQKAIYLNTLRTNQQKRWLIGKPKPAVFMSRDEKLNYQT